MHEILYTNGDGASEPDRICVPKPACGELYDKEELSQEHSGALGPYPERLDNYGNRWLEGGFEYPPYEGHISAGKTSDDLIPEPSGPPPRPDFGADGDNAPAVKPLPEMTGTSTLRKGNETGASSVSGHTGQRSDKWPAIGLTNFKPSKGA